MVRAHKVSGSLRIQVPGMLVVAVGCRAGAGAGAGTGRVGSCCCCCCVEVDEKMMEVIAAGGSLGF